jgi:hypothetical protein
MIPPHVFRVGEIPSPEQASLDDTSFSTDRRQEPRRFPEASGEWPRIPPGIAEKQ